MELATFFILSTKRIFTKLLSVSEISIKLRQGVYNIFHKKSHDFHNFTIFDMISHDP